MKASLLRLNIGELVLCRGRECEIKQILTTTRVLVQATRGGDRPEVAQVSDLKPLEAQTLAPSSVDTGDDPQSREQVEEEPNVDRSAENTDLEHISEAHINIAKRRLEVIRPLLLERTTAEVVARAAEHRVSVPSIYRWIAAYTRTERLSALVPRFKMRGGPLKSRLQAGSEEIVRRVIERFFLSENRPSKVETAREVIAECRKAGLKPPCVSSVRNRITALSEKLVTRRRLGAKAARRFRGLRGSLPGAEHPWAIVHMDHTKLDLEVVDRETRMPIGRPFITLAEDAFSRVIVGFYLSLDAPSSVAVGICMSDAMLPKEWWLASRGVESGEWPVWGKPEVVHVDNAKEFRSRALERACDELGISIHWRRAGIPEDGARVERLISTIGEEIHKLPGTTFSNPKERGEYDSEAKAALTLDELEYYIAEWIVNMYHHRPHQSLGGRPPIAVWNEGLLHGADLGLGLPARPANPTELRLKFLPFEKRTIQPYGIRWDGITYWSEHLEHWIGAKDPKDGRRPQSFTVRRDPRNISSVWFWDPRRHEHIELHYRDATRPAMSLWELREIQAALKAKGRTEINEDIIFAARDRMRAATDEAVRATKAARLGRERAARRAEGAAKLRPPSVLPATPPMAPAPMPAVAATAMAFEEIVF